ADADGSVPPTSKQVSIPARTPSLSPQAGVAAAAVDGAALAAKLDGLGLTPAQVEGVLALSREVVEQVVWEVVPELAEVLIREEIRRLTA
ncbi:MAG: response regulator, partial [Polyangiales bacterium]